MVCSSKLWRFNRTRARPQRVPLPVTHFDTQMLMTVTIVPITINCLPLGTSPSLQPSTLSVPQGNRKHACSPKRCAPEALCA